MNLSRILSSFANEAILTSTRMLGIRGCHSMNAAAQPHSSEQLPPATEKAPASTPTESDAELDKLYKTVELELKSNDPAVLNSYVKFATLAGKHLEIESRSWNLRKPKKELFTVYKSVHIYKKHKAQYELRTYFTFVQFKHLTGSTCDTLLEYLQRNLPEGVALKTSKIELQTLPNYLASS